MNQNLISATLTSTQRDELIADIHALRAKMAGYLVTNLTAEAKAELLKMGIGNLALEDIMRTAATDNAGKLANDFPLADWDEDRAFAGAFDPVADAFAKLNDDVQDTLFLANSDRMWAAMEAYGDIKKDGTGPAIDQARAIMRQRRRGRGTPPPTDPPQA